MKLPNRYDLMGVGIGPFNLSLAALLTPETGLKACFLEKADEVKWHQGLLFPFSSLTVSFVKDLVSLADPKSRYTFLNYLFENKKIYQFINADLPRVSRLEFEHYMQWVSTKLSTLKFSSEVKEISYEENKFLVHTENEKYYAKNIVLGHGAIPHIPQFAKPHLGDSVISAADFLHTNLATKDKTIAVVGGGQTSSEIILHLLMQHENLPKEILWISPRTILWPLDETPFSNELYTPNFDNYFYDLDDHVKGKILRDLKFTGDGITTSNLKAIYHQLYHHKFINNNSLLKIKLSHSLENMQKKDLRWELSLKDLNKNVDKKREADIVILATGFQNPFPSFLTPLKEKINWDNGFTVNPDFSIQWENEHSNKIFVQNAARKSHGIADPYFSLMAWRSAQIINSILQKNFYDINDQHTLIHWG